jgi:hypothetical protein
VAILLVSDFVSIVAAASAGSTDCHQFDNDEAKCAKQNGACDWCATFDPDGPPTGFCYSKASNETCCAGTFNGQDGGEVILCNSSSTCVLSTVQSHYGPFSVPSCCTATMPVGCNGACYAKDYACCNTIPCHTSTMCCNGGFQASTCCALGSVCCALSWGLTCCPAKSQCNYSNYPPTCAKN